jgi:predicted RecA/RadA family phage recombinase
MATNEIFKVGQSISLPVASTVKSGDPVRVGVLNGVAIVDAGDGGNASTHTSVDLFGGHLFKNLTGATVGQAVYITGAGALTLTVGTNKLFGAVTHLHPRVPNSAVVLTQSISV